MTTTSGPPKSPFCFKKLSLRRKPERLFVNETLLRTAATGLPAPPDSKDIEHASRH